MLAAQLYFGGGTPAYADYAVFGCFQWARCISAFHLLLEDDPVWAWRERLLSAFDGLARKAIGIRCDAAPAVAAGMALSDTVATGKEWESANDGQGVGL